MASIRSDAAFFLGIDDARDTKGIHTKKASPMSDVLTTFQAILDPKARGEIRGTAKLEISGEGTIMLTEDGATIGDQEADVTLKASAATFEAILDGSQNPVMAYMSGKLKVDGNAQRALKVSTILTT